MKRSASLSACAVIGLVAVAAPSLRAATRGSAASSVPAAAAAARPKLVVLLAVDQMRADYVDRYGGSWKHGLHTLLEQGAVFTQARYPYLSTVTCPGHTTIGTGAYPHRHGMVLNAWWDRAQQKLIECTDDPGSPLISYGQSTGNHGDSGKNILVPTLADEMKSQLQPVPRVVSFSFKARSAIGLSGHRGDIVTWYEDGGWVTARAFAQQPNPVVARLLGANPIDRALAHPWQKVLPPEAYRYDDGAPEEPVSGPWTRTLPKPLDRSLPPGTPGGPAQKYALWERSPLPDETLGRLAQGALTELKLGRGQETDFLDVSFSSLDIVGHAYGPLSHEVQDVLGRLDRVIGDLLATLDGQVGRGNYVVALSADHGVAIFPERLRAEGQDAGRISMAEVANRVNAALITEIGPGRHIANISYTDIYLSKGVMEKLRPRSGAVGRVLAAMRGIEGVAAAFCTDDLRDPARTTDPVQRAAALSHLPARSGDLILVPKLNWLTVSSGTTHGSNHEYDQHVPVVLYGAGIRPGRYDRPASPADVAPTLARLVGVKMPRAEGTPLTEALMLSSAAAPRAPGAVKGRRGRRP